MGEAAIFTADATWSRKELRGALPKSHNHKHIIDRGCFKPLGIGVIRNIANNKY